MPISNALRGHVVWVSDVVCVLDRSVQRADRKQLTIGNLEMSRNPPVSAGADAIGVLGQVRSDCCVGADRTACADPSGHGSRLSAGARLPNATRYAWNRDSGRLTVTKRPSRKPLARISRGTPASRACPEPICHWTPAVARGCCRSPRSSTRSLASSRHSRRVRFNPKSSFHKASS